MTYIASTAIRVPVDVHQITGVIVDENRKIRTVNRSFVSPSASGNTEVVPAQGVGVKIRVIAYIILAKLANDVKFQSATTDVSQIFPFGANGGIVVGENGQGWMQTAANEALNVNLGTATMTGVTVVWIQAE